MVALLFAVQYLATVTSDFPNPNETYKNSLLLRLTNFFEDEVGWREILFICDNNKVLTWDHL